VEIRDLTIFVAVAKTGSVTKAAEQLGYVQSNITARIRHLENTLGTALFHRLPRGMTLTPAGETLLSYAEQILHLSTEAEQAVQDSERPSGTLRIGATQTTMATRLPAILAEYHKAFPKVDLSLSTGHTDQLIQAILNFELEAALVTGPVEHPLIEPAAVIEEDLVLVSGSGDMDFPSTGGHLTILPFGEGCLYRKKLEQYLDHIGIQSRKVIELGTLDGILGCVAAGLGVALVPKAVIEMSKYKMATHELPPQFSEVPTVLVRRKDAFQSSALSKFITVVQDSRSHESSLHHDDSSRNM
jgi:LysR family transcriptional regulator, cell division regulator